jgi:ankyrin repeat protein
MSNQELIDAIDCGDADAVRRHLDDSPESAAARDEQGVSLVLHALYRGQAEVAELLAEHRQGALDLLEATALGRRPLAEQLLAADPEAVARRSPDGFTPLHYAAFFGQAELADLLLRKGADVDAEAANPTRVRPLHSAVARGDLTICRRLLSAGANPDRQQQAGYTALMSAALHGNRELADLLLEHGADRAIQSDDGRTAADFAKEGGHSELAQLLAAGG